MRIRQVVGFKQYKVTDCGEIIGVLGHKLKQNETHHGYLRVGLFKNGRAHNKYVHRLVLDAFLYPRPAHASLGEVQTNHKDRNKKNNNIDNLEWVTCSENHRSRVWPDDVSAGLKKLVDGEVWLIKKLVWAGQSCRFVAKMFKVNKNTINAIKNKKTWKQICCDEER